MKRPGCRRAWLAAVVLATFSGLAGCGGDSGSTSSSSCGGCHGEIEARASFESSHSLLYDCTFCHAPAKGDPGPGHRAIRDCAACHSERSHPPGLEPAPGESVATSCVRCHDPHGSANLRLIREEVAGSPISFTSLDGYASGSYAEPRAGSLPGRGAGTGLCEVCHDATFTYRHDGQGLPHHTVRCTECHSHADAFLPSHG